VRRLSSYVGGLVAGFAPTSWWNVFLFWRWGSPLFPYYNSIFRSPYYPAVNFRDLRFEFHSLPELTNFLFEATRETRKTLELPFADARLLIFVVLMSVVLVAWVLKRLASRKIIFGNSPTRVTATFLWFVSTSFALWALVFAYERYLIPIELLLGIAIWILVAQMVEGQRHIVAMTTIFLIVSLATIEVPDWGHWTGQPVQRNFVGIDISDKVASTPADYLVYGKWMTYILPFLNPDSRFFGITFLPQADPRFDKRIKAALAANRTRPIRLLTAESNLTEASAQVATLGLRSEPDCWHFQSDFDRFAICKVHTQDTFGVPER